MPKTCGHLDGFLYIAITEIASGPVQEVLLLSGLYLGPRDFLFSHAICVKCECSPIMMTFHAFVVCFDQDWF